jgi:long-chain acyl-CoA synthetase
MSLLWPILRNAIFSPRRVAVVDDQRSYSYGKLLGGALFVADKIESTTSNSKVGILLPTGGGFPVALLATWMCRRTAVPLNYLLSVEELRYIIADSGIDTIITAGPMLQFLGGEEKLVPPGVGLIKLEQMDFTGFPPLRWPPILGDDELAVILYTSGTSGKPKGVMLTHENLQFDAEAGIRHAELTGADVFLGVLPQFHSFGLTALTLIPLRIGAKTVYTARFIPKKIVELIRKHQADVFMAVPSMYGALLSVKDATAEDFKSLRLPISGGEPLSDAVFAGCMERFGFRILEGYGLTETAPCTNWCTPTRWKRYSVGQSLPDIDIIVVDEQDRPVPPDVEGEILIHGRNVMKGYYNLPKETAEVFTTIGGKRFFRTGDIGKLDAEGYLFITGRKKEMLIIGGENVFPREIEEVLAQHPAVHAAAVIGKRDDMRGEVPIAFVEMEQGQEFDAGHVRAFCRDRLAQFKVPREIRCMEKLPRNPTGKIMRRELSAD